MKEYSQQELATTEILECTNCQIKIESSPKEIKLPKGWIKMESGRPEDFMHGGKAVLYCPKCRELLRLPIRRPDEM